jgi:DNA-binding transcriptional ArsR family regulator
VSGEKTRPPWCVALERIRLSDLEGAPYRVLRAMVEWWSPASGELWPSVASIADGARLHPGTVRKAVKLLKAAGVLEVVEQSRGRHPNVYRIHLDRLNPRAARGSGGDIISRLARGADRHNSSAAHDERERATPPTLAQRVINPRAARDEPSIHQPENEPREKTGAEAIASGDGWMEKRTAATGSEDDPKALRDALVAEGIRGPNLDALATCGKLTEADVRREAAGVRLDPKVRSAPAVLAQRLANLAGVELKRGPELDARQRDAIGRIEHLRRHRGPNVGIGVARLEPESVRRAAGMDSPDPPGCGTLDGKGS